MEATEILKDEHRLIMRALAALEKASSRLEAGESVKPVFFIESSDFIQGYADGCHHHKEEGLLFPAMIQAGLPRDSGPVAAMLAEHEQARHFTRGMRQAAEALLNGDASSKVAVISMAMQYVRLLRQHIQKEDFILFPMAEKIISLDVQPRLDASFSQVLDEERMAGLPEKFFTLAVQLEAECLE